jgi:hypothetical protein
MHYRTEVQAEQVIFLDGRQTQAANTMPEEELPDAVGQEAS